MDTKLKAKLTVLVSAEKVKSRANSMVFGAKDISEETEETHLINENDRREEMRRDAAARIIQRSLMNHFVKKKEFKKAWLSCVKMLKQQREELDQHIARKLGLDTEDCSMEALKELRIAIGNGELDPQEVWDQVVIEGKQLLKIKKRAVRVEVFANGMELICTHIPLTAIRVMSASVILSSATPAKKPALDHYLQSACALCHAPHTLMHVVKKDEFFDEVAKTVLQKMLHLYLFDLDNFRFDTARFEKKVQEHDPRLPGLTISTEITVVPVHVLEPTKLPSFGLPQGANFSLHDRCGKSLWKWRHREAHPPTFTELRTLLSGRLLDDKKLRNLGSSPPIFSYDEAHEERKETVRRKLSSSPAFFSLNEEDEENGSSEDDEDALEWLCRGVLCNHSVQACWLRRPICRRGPMLLLLRGRNEAEHSCPRVLEFIFGKVVGAKDAAAENIRNALGDSATHIVGDVMHQSSTPHGVRSERLSHSEWQVVELKLPKSLWGVDCSAGEASINSLRELVRDSYAAEIRIVNGMEEALHHSQVSGGARSRAGEDTKDLLADLLGSRSPLVSLMSVSNFSKNRQNIAKGSSDILTVPFQSIIRQLRDDDPLPRYLYQILPGVYSNAVVGTPTEDLIEELEALSKVIEKLKTKRWYAQKPWKTRHCLTHGSFDTGHVLVGGLRQMWVAGLSDKHESSGNAMRDVADFSTSLLLEDCQLPVVEKDLPVLMQGSTFNVGELADWLETDENSLTEYLPSLSSSLDIAAEQENDLQRRRSQFALRSGDSDTRRSTVRSSFRGRSKRHSQTMPAQTLPELEALTPANSSRSSTISARSSMLSRRPSEFNARTSTSGSPRSMRRPSMSGRPSRRAQTARGSLDFSMGSLLEEEDRDARAEKDKVTQEVRKAFGKRHRELVVRRRAEAKSAYWEAVEFSEEFAERLPDALAGEGLGPPPETLERGPFSWAWELQRPVIALAADRLAAQQDGVFDQPADKNDAVGAGRRTAATMIPLILAALGLVRRTPTWQRFWVLVHAACLTRKLVEVLTQVADIANERRASASHRHHSAHSSNASGTDDAEVEADSGRSSVFTSRSSLRFHDASSAPGMPHVNFAKDHRLWVVNPSAEKTDETPMVAGTVTASSDIYSLDDGRELDIEEAVPLLGLPCGSVGMSIQQGRIRRRLDRAPDHASGESPAAIRKRAFQHISGREKVDRCMTGKVLDIVDIRSPHVSLVEKKDLDRDKALEFTFNGANFTGRGYTTLSDDVLFQRVLSAAHATDLLSSKNKDPNVDGSEDDKQAPTSFIEKHVKHTWSYRSADESHVIFGDGASEARSCLHKLLVPSNRKSGGAGMPELLRGGIRGSSMGGSLPLEKPGNAFPGTLSYMVYSCEVTIDSVFVEGTEEPPEQGQADVFFAGVRSIHPAKAFSGKRFSGVDDSSPNAEQGTGRKDKRGSKSKDRQRFSTRDCNSVVMARFDFTYRASKDVDIYPYGARIRIYRGDDSVGRAATVITMCKSGEYVLRLDGGSESIQFDLRPKNCEPAGIYRYETQQKLVVYDDGVWANATVINVKDSNCHELEVTYKNRSKTLVIDLNECNHTPAWLSLLDFERAARKYASEIRANYGFLVDPVSGRSLDILKLPFSVAFSGSPPGQADALPELLSMVDPPTDRHRGVLETRGVVVWGPQSYGKTTLSKRLAVACICNICGFLPIMVDVKDILNFVEHEADPLDMLLWERYGSTDLNLGIYRLLRQALYCRRAFIILDGADAGSKMWPRVISFCQKLVDSGHRTVMFSRLPPLGHPDHPHRRSGYASSLASVPATGSTAGFSGSISLPPPSASFLATPSQSQSFAATPGGSTETSMASFIGGQISSLMAPRAPARVSHSPRASGVPSSHPSFLSNALPSAAASRDKALSFCLPMAQSHSSATANKEKALHVLAKAGTPPLLQLELRLLTLEAQHEAVTARFLDKHPPWLNDHLHAANDVGQHPFGLMLLLGHVEATQAEWEKEHSGTKGELNPILQSELFLMKFMQSATEMCVSTALNQPLSVGVSQPPCNVDDCLRLLEIIALHLQRCGLGEIPFADVEHLFCHELDEDKLIAAWQSLAGAVEDQRLQLLQGARSLQHVHALDSMRTPVRFIHSSLQDYFAARCCMRYIACNRPTGLPAFEELLFQDSYIRFFRFLFELLEMHQLPTTLDFSGRDLGPERFDKLIAFFGSRNWSTPVVKLVVSGRDQVPSLDHLSLLLESSVAATMNFSLHCYPLEAKGMNVFAHTLNWNRHALKSLDLRNCSMGSEGIRILTEEVLAGGFSLAHLNLGGNGIGPHGAMHIGLALQTNMKLEFLELENNGLRSDGAEALSKSVHGCSSSALRYLGMASNRLSDEGMVHVVELMHARWNLREIDIAGNSIHGVGFQRLAEGMEADMPWQQLCISGNEGGPDGMWHISKALRMLQGSSALRRLHLEHARLGLEGISHLADALMAGVVLESLELRSNRLSGKGVSRLAAALRVTFTRGFGKLTRLGLRSNSCRDEGAIAVADMLKDERGLLEDLDLSENLIGDRGAIEVAGALKSEGAAAGRCLHTLKLNSNSIGPQGAEALASAFTQRRQTKPILQRLELSGNDVRDDGASALASALMTSPALCCLEVQRARIGFIGASTLVKAVVKMKSIQRIALEGNFIGEQLQPYAEDLCHIRVGMPIAIDTSAGGPEDVQVKWTTELRQDVADRIEKLGLPKVPPMSRHRALLEGIVTWDDSEVSQVLPKANSRQSAWSSLRSMVQSSGSSFTSALLKPSMPLLEPVCDSKPPKASDKSTETVSEGRRSSKKVSVKGLVITGPSSHSLSIASTQASTETSRFNI